MKEISFAPVLFLASVLLSCSGTTDPDPTLPQLVPLAVGNTWIGEYRDYDTAGTHIRTRIDTSLIVRDTIVDGESVYLLYGRRSGGLTGRRDVANRPGGYSLRDPSNGRWFLQFKYPAVAGDRYRLAEDFYTGSDSLWMDLIATAEKTVAGGKEYACYHYFEQSNFGENDVHVYIAPGVGIVKMHWVDRPGNNRTARTTEWELKEYTLR